MIKQHFMGTLGETNVHGQLQGRESLIECSGGGNFIIECQT